MSQKGRIPAKSQTKPDIKLLAMYKEDVENPKRTHREARSYLEAFQREHSGDGEVVTSAPMKGGL